MKAWLLDKLAGVETMRLADVDPPRAGGGDVVIELDLAALNPADKYLAEGQYPARPPLPHVLGRDGFGTIIEVGGGVTNWKVGETALILRGEVGVARWGTLAEKVAAPAESLAKLPAGWTAEQAAGAPLVYMTAYQAITQWDKKENQVILVTGVSGGVGVATVQLGKALGHTVIGLSRSAEKSAKVVALGADLVLDPADTQWRKRIKEFLGERKVDIAVDNIGGPLFNELLDVMGMWGGISVVGRLAGPVPQFNTASLFFRRLRVGGVAVGTYTPAETREVWGRVVELLGKSGARPVIDSRWKLEQVPQAFEALAKGPMGKVLVTVR
jgi:NADPH2:quinone reductase